MLSSQQHRDAEVHSLHPRNGVTDSTAMQSQKAVTAYFSSEQLLPFGFAGQMIQRNEWGMSHVSLWRADVCSYRKTG